MKKSRIHIIRFTFITSIGCMFATRQLPAAVTIGSSLGPPAEPLSTWYTRPASVWTEAAPIGNGRLGAMVWGIVDSERIQINEDTFWSGRPYTPTNGNALAAINRTNESCIFAGLVNHGTAGYTFTVSNLDNGTDGMPPPPPAPIDPTKLYQTIEGLGGATADSYLGNLTSATNVFPNKPRFMTECGELQDMIECANLIRNCLVVEQVSGYNHWNLIWPGTSGGLIQIEFPWDRSQWTNVPPGTPPQSHGRWLTPAYYAMRHYLYFIQPGYKRVAATRTDTKKLEFRW